MWAAVPWNLARPPVFHGYDRAACRRLLARRFRQPVPQHQRRRTDRIGDLHAEAVKLDRIPRHAVEHGLHHLAVLPHLRGSDGQRAGAQVLKLLVQRQAVPLPSYVLGPEFGPALGDGLPPVEAGDVAIMPVPEPASLALLVAGALLMRRR